MVHESISNHCVLMDRGEGDEEWLFVKCNAFENPTIFGVVYGPQEGRTPQTKIQDMWKNITTKLIEYEGKGWDVYVAGDMNLAVGNSLGLEGNDPKISEGGKWLVEWIQENNWNLANSMYKGDCRTHVDRSSGKQKCLDLLITNRMEKVNEVNCDEKGIIGNGQE